jgi:hypothetical protein
MSRQGHWKIARGGAVFAPPLAAVSEETSAPAGAVEEAAQTIHSRALSGRQLFSPVSRDGEIRPLTRTHLLSLVTLRCPSGT